MMNIYRIANSEKGLESHEIEEALIESLDGRSLKNVLILPPDFTRYHSNAGFITNYYYHYLTDRGCNVDLLPTLGTHVPMTSEQIKGMYGDIPFEKFIPHDWRNDVIKIGEVPADYMKEISDGTWTEAVEVEINKIVLDPKYDLVISPGQVVPHEVVGMSNHAKNLFVGAGGASIINSSHMVGAVYGMEKMMGKADTPVRRIYDYALEHFLDKPVLFVLTVTTAPYGETLTHGLFIGEDRDCFEKAVELAQEKNIDFVETGIKKCVVYLDPEEFQSTWLGNKAIYRTRMAIADGGELIILAPGVDRFGEDEQVDKLIRKYGYKGTPHIMECLVNQDLRENLSAAAHLIHGSSEGRFSITYCVKEISKEEIESVGFKAEAFDLAVEKYNPDKLVYGYNIVEGEEIYYIPNPALGLWINKEKFNN